MVRHQNVSVFDLIPIQYPIQQVIICVSLTSRNSRIRLAIQTRQNAHALGELRLGVTSLLISGSTSSFRQGLMYQEIGAVHSVLEFHLSLAKLRESCRGILGDCILDILALDFQDELFIIELMSG